MSAPDVNAAVTHEPGTVTRPTGPAIVEWCRNYVAQVLNIPAEKIDPNADFDSLGLDSVVAVALVAEIGAWLGMDLEPEVLFQYPTIASLAEHLAQQ